MPTFWASCSWRMYDINSAKKLKGENNDEKSSGRSIKPATKNKYLRELKLRLPPVKLLPVILYTAAVSSSLSLGYNAYFAIITGVEESCFNPFPSTILHMNWVVNGYIYALWMISAICWGFLADTKLGYGTVIRYCLRLSWFGSLLQIISYCVQYGTCGLPVNIAKYGISGVALTVIFIGHSGFFVNMLSFGVALMPSASSTQLRSFIHWLVWAVFVGYL